MNRYKPKYIKDGRRYCSKCSFSCAIEDTAKFFYVQKNRVDGYRSNCIECEKEYQKKAYLAKQEKKRKRKENPHPLVHLKKRMRAAVATLNRSHQGTPQESQAGG